MAKKNKDVADTPVSDVQEVLETAEPKPQKEPKPKKVKKKKKKSFPLVPVLVLAVVVGGIVAALVFNVFDFRERFVMPYLREAPLIGRFFPAPEAVEETPAGRYDSMTSEEIDALVTALEVEIENLNGTIEALEAQGEEDQATITNLREYERQMTQLREDRAALDEIIARGDMSGYAEYYKSIAPENAERLYQEIVGELEVAAEEKRMAATYVEMDPGAAALGLESILTTNQELVVRLLSLMDSRSRALIFEELEPGNLAIVTQLMYPEEVLGVEP